MSQRALCHDNRTAYAGSVCETCYHVFAALDRTNHLNPALKDWFSKLPIPSRQPSAKTRYIAGAAVGGKVGGVKRWEGYTAEQRSAHARKMSLARWGKKTPQALSRKPKPVTIAAFKVEPPYTVQKVEGQDPVQASRTMFKAYLMRAGGVKDHFLHVCYWGKGKNYANDQLAVCSHGFMTEGLIPTESDRLKLHVV